MTSSPDSTLLCPSCSGQNAPDSKFCRHCGQALDGASLGASTVAPSSDLDMPDEVLPSVALSADGATADEALSSPGEIDGRRARQLLERAHGLNDRGDTAGALLACRQAIALAPTIVGGHAMLGTLLERNGDMPHALQAFEKAAQLAPESGAMRDVERLREKMGPKPDAPVFHFDDAELFGDDNIPTATLGSALPGLAINDSAPAAERASAFVTPEIEGASEVSITGIEAAFPPVHEPITVAAETDSPQQQTLIEGSDTPTPAIAAAIPPVRERRVADVPVRVERRVSTSAGVLPSATPIGARVQSQVPLVTAPVINPVSFGDTATAPQGWGAMWARPSYFARSLPLVGATVLSLGFLGWARGLADARNMASAPSAVVASAPATNSPVADPAPADAAPGAAPATNSNLPPLAPVGGETAPAGGFPISNQRGGNAALTPPASTANNAPNAAPQNTGANRSSTSRPVTGRPAAPRSATGTTGRSANGQRSAALPPQLLAPARIPPQRGVRPAPASGAPSARNAARGGSSDFTLPAPVISQPAPAAPATSVLPAGGSTALNPSGASGRGYVRITQGRVGSTLPLRSSARAGDAERGAAAAARGGSTTQAIDGLTAAINANSSDAGFRYQQRATLFLQQGDYSRAADDFQAAISAYNDQIERGVEVASARAGLRAARSGLNLALAGGR